MDESLLYHICLGIVGFCLAAFGIRFLLIDLMIPTSALMVTGGIVIVAMSGVSFRTVTDEYNPGKHRWVAVACATSCLISLVAVLALPVSHVPA